jgi:dipeptidase E
MVNSRLLLISSSVVYGTGYLDHAEVEIRDHLQNIETVLFVPYAIRDYDGYFTKVKERCSAMGYGVESIHHAQDPARSVQDAQAIFIGGGNTFRLLKTLYEKRLLEEIRSSVARGTPYIGSSAGTNVACPTIRTTNDMPIVEPPSLTALGLVPFQINPHYLDPDPNSKHMGETREERIGEFLEENDLAVIGLREGCMIRVKNDDYLLKGISSARIFQRNMQPFDVHPVCALNPHLNG